MRLDGRALVESVLAQEPGLAAALPMGNEEADMVGGWNHQLPWHSDAFNAAGLVRLLAMHEDMINANQSLSKKIGPIRSFGNMTYQNFTPQLLYR